MAQPAELSEFLHADRPALRTTTGNQTLVVERHLQPAEVAQARLFEGILQSEFANLHRLAYRAAGSRNRHDELDGRELPRDLLRIQARIDEVHRLLQALRGRFPDPRCDGELPAQRGVVNWQSGRSPDAVGAM